MKCKVYNLGGEITGEMDLSAAVFEVEKNADLLHQVIVSLQSNRRRAIAHTKTRAEVRGGGRKPWKQKGTGRARAGSLRSPIFKGGGVIFGPRSNRNFSKKINRKMKQKAFLIALSSKVKDSEMRIVENFDIAHAKTKVLVEFIAKIGGTGKSVLFVSPQQNANLKRSLANIDRAKFLMAGGISSLDLLNNKFLILDKEAAAYYSGKKEPTTVEKKSAAKREKQEKAVPANKNKGKR